MRLSVFGVATQREALEQLAELAQRSTVHPLVRETAIRLTADCDARDDDCELQAIFNAVKYGTVKSDDLRGFGRGFGLSREENPLARGVRYVADPRWADHFTAPYRLLKQCARGACAGDCLPADTLLLGAGHKLIPIEDVEVGSLVMGDGQWTHVTQKWDKGVQEILEFELNNGCVLRCTPEHKVFVVPKHRGHAGTREGAEERRAGEVRPGDDLLTVQSLPYGHEGLGADRARLLGLHIAEGWVDYSEKDHRPLRVGISGLDGYRKEANKHLVQAICERLNVPTRWHEKYVAINDEDLARWLAACGRRAPNKHVPSLNLDEASVTELMAGLAADADIRNGVFSTTSPLLALQYRVMLRMQGRSSHIAQVDDHGGLGKNPIFRVTPRAVDDRRRQHARVRAISEGESTRTFDIEVEGHRFYLPETDLIVHNCDDHGALIVALAGSLGFKVGLRVWGPTPAEFVHVFAVACVPKRDPREVIGLDTTVDESSVGWMPPSGSVMTAWLE